MGNLKDIRRFLLDMDGTLYLGDRMFAATPAFLEGIRTTGRRFLLLTNNSSMSIQEYHHKLGAMGLRIEMNEIFSSATATLMYLNRIKPGARIFLLATPGVTEEFSRAGFIITGQGPDFVVLTFDKTLTYDKVEQACRLLRRGVPFIATHPDLVCPTEDLPIPDCGSMIQMLTAATGVEPTIIGKPHREMIDAALARLDARPSETAIVGDRLYTDMRMGFRTGLTTVLVLSGETTRQAVEQESKKPDYVVGSVKDLVEMI